MLSPSALICTFLKTCFEHRLLFAGKNTLWVELVIIGAGFAFGNGTVDADKATYGDNWNSTSRVSFYEI